MDIIKTLVIIFATSSGLICVYTLVSSYLLYTSRLHLSDVEEFGKLVNALFLTVFTGFIYAFWTLLIQLKIVIIENQFVVTFVSNILVIILFIMLAYLAFFTRQLSKKFGFKIVGERIVQTMDVPLKKPVKKASKARKR